jgi:hypothetical protein
MTIFVVALTFFASLPQSLALFSGKSPAAEAAAYNLERAHPLDAWSYTQQWTTKTGLTTMAPTRVAPAIRWSIKSTSV